LFDPVSFDLVSHQLGFDEDGDAINSLVAKHINSAEELLSAKSREVSSLRGGKTRALLDIAHNGMSEKELRYEFYKSLLDMDPEAKRKAFNRAKAAAVDAGFIEMGLVEGTMERRVIVLKGVE
jgi:hypothetical protein